MELRCTECSRPVLPVVAVDIDGTLAEYHLALTRFACHYWDRPLPRFTWNGVGNFEDHLGLTQAEYREAKLAYRQGGYKRIADLYEGALAFMGSLSSMPVEVWLATTRPWSRLDNVDPDTKFWLARHKIPFHHLLFDDMKYRQLATIVDPDRVIAVVEDLPEQLDSAQTYLPSARPMMISRPHNAGTRNGYEWHIAFHRPLDHIEKAVQAWRS